MSDRVREFKAAALASIEARLNGFARELESPIEEELFWALIAEADGVDDVFGALVLGYNGGFYQLEVKPQAKLCLGRYRVDLMLDVLEPVRRKSTPFEPPELRIAVECDGHDFHEKTKDQAQRDKARDRELQALGLRVIRFTGSEIRRDPATCARAVIDLVRAMCRPIVVAAMAGGA